MDNEERNYAAELRAVIDAETADGSPYIAKVIAEQVVEKLRANDPDLLDGFLRAHEVQIVYKAINERDASRRAYVRVAATRSVFREAAQAAADSGDMQGVARFLTTVYTVEDGTRVRLSEMRKPDLLYVADRYADRAKDNLLQEAFMRRLAKKVGSGQVSDHFTDARLAEIWQSITAS